MKLSHSQRMVEVLQENSALTFTAKELALALIKNFLDIYSKKRKDLKILVLFHSM